ncbi:MAG: LytTR family transcriptional regulator [Lachnospiraceae bacterium]|nr:LytTR family transcriptional regulator [Lachnospiraceae bacterium]
MLKAALCLEDAEHCCKVIEEIGEYYRETGREKQFGKLITDIYHTSDSFLKSRKTYDLVLLETFLEGGIGVAVGMRIWKENKNTRVILIRDNEDAVSIINKTHCFGILDRGNEGGLRSLLDEYFLTLEQEPENRILQFRSDEGQLYKLAPGDIMYACTEPVKRNRVVLKLSGEEGSLLVMGKFTGLSEELERCGFLNISRNCSVNPTFISFMEKDSIMMKNGILLPVPRRRVAQIRKTLDER